MTGCGSVTAATDAGDGAAPDVPVVPSGDAGMDSVASMEHAPETKPPNPALNLLPNGDFANGLTGGWNVTPIGTTASVVNGQLCTTLTPNVRAYIGWGPPDPSMPLMLAGGSRLVLSFKASTTANLLVFTPQVGHTSAPFTPVFTQPELLPVGASTTISREFVVPAAGDTSVGMVFLAEAATAATVCVDDVYVGPP
jgi:hypothetical protein